MVWSYEYTPYVWPVLASVALSTVLLIQGIRYRSAPGAVPFVALVAGILAWTLANGLATVGMDDPTRFFWFKFQTALSLPTVTAGLCFAVEYAGLGRLLTRRTVALLAVVPLACAILILTDSTHHLMWTRIWFDGYVRCDKGIASWWAIAYAYSLSVLHLLVLAWLFVRSPRHRGIAAALILTALSVRCVSFFKFANWAPVLRFDPMVVVTAFALLPYAVAVFRFRMFDVVPVARNLIIEQMADAMIVLDAGNRIADLNRAAETLLGAVRSRAVGRHVAEALPSRPDLLALIDSPAKPQCEVSLGNNRFYQVSIAPLIDERGFQLGRLISLHEITELKRAQDQILDHQRTLAMLNERELLARELHDGIAQTLAAAHLQARSAKELLAQGATAAADSCLDRLSEATQEAKESVREYLLGVQARSFPEQGLIPVLRRYLDQYSHDYGIRIELAAPPALEGQRIDPVIEAQLQPIVQEAIANARRHGKANSVRVTFAPRDGRLEVAIEDDGCGFDPDQIAGVPGFGLRSMRGRTEAVGGVFQVSSKPGEGTRVTIQVPWRKADT